MTDCANLKKTCHFDGPANTDNPDYIDWLKKESMLYQADKLARKFSGTKAPWRNPYSAPQSKQAVAEAPVWFNCYPSATISREGQNFFETFSDEQLWQVFEEIGIQALRTGPVKQAGGIVEGQYTPTIDGWFDRIKLAIDPAFGNEEQYHHMVETAKKHNAIVAGDIVPGHTGKGADFRLAERGFENYPGIYAMIEVDEADWPLLPKIKNEWESVNLTPKQVGKLIEKAYIPGRLQRVLFTVPGVKREFTGWDATAPIKGVDGKIRRWVYLHYFKQGQPTMNWLDPSFASARIISGDLLMTLKELGARFVRLDANSFLGIEYIPESETSWSEGHPLSVQASNYIAFMARKFGGWSFQELNLSVAAISEFGKQGADLAYDFVTRPAVQHAILTKDAGFLKLMLGLMTDYDIPPESLIHDMQNHDEITYELVHFLEHPDDNFTLNGQTMTGHALREKIVGEMHQLAMGDTTPYNRLSGNGLCTTFAGLMAARLRITDLDSLTDEDIATIKKGHILLAIFNAMQPGVFGLSGWDLGGVLPLDCAKIPELLEDGDTRWINRGAFDLAEINPQATHSADGLPRGRSLYGSVPKQLKDKTSFVSQIKNIIAKRNAYKLHIAELAGYLPTANKATVLMAHTLPENGGIEITGLNFGDELVLEKADLSSLVSAKELAALKNKTATDIITGKTFGTVDNNGRLSITLDKLEGIAIVFK